MLPLYLTSFCPVNANVALVVDPIAIGRAGLEVALRDHGWAVEASDGLGIHCDGSFDVGVVAVREPANLDTIKRLAGASVPPPIVAVVASTHPERSAGALMAGACAAIEWDSPVAVLVSVVGEAASGRSLLSAPLLAWLLDNCRPALGASDEETKWLATLDRGCTVAQLAQVSGYSERSMYRLLHRLYDRLGVTNRHEAIGVLRADGLM